MQGNDQRRIGLDIFGNMNALLPVQPIVLKRNVLAKSTHGQKKDGGNRDSHGFNIAHLSNRTTEIISISEKTNVPQCCARLAEAWGVL